MLSGLSFNSLAAGYKISATGTEGLVLNNTAGGTNSLLLSTGGNPLVAVPLSLASNLVADVAAGSLTLGGAISGPGGLTKTDSGTLVLTGSNSYGGGTNVNGGILRLAAAGALPGGAAPTIAAGGTLDLNGNNYTLPGIGGSGSVLLGSATLTINNAAAGTVSTSISGSGGVIKSGNGDLTFAASDSYTGGTTVNGGRLILAAAVQSTTFTANAGGTLQFGNATFNPWFGSIRAQAGGTVQYNGATINGGYLRGPGTHTTLAGSSNFFNGSTTYNSTAFQQFGADTFTNFTNGGTLTNGTLTNHGATLLWDGGINAASGRMTVNGTAVVQDLENDGFITINSGGVINNAVSDLVSGGGSQIIINAGGQLNVNSDGSGMRLDLQGSLLVNNGTITGMTNVYYGATAKGAVGVYGPVTINDGGKFSPGNSPGVVTSATTVWNSGGQYLFEINSATGTAGSNWDLWDINGTLSIAAGNTSNSKFTIAVTSESGTARGRSPISTTRRPTSG